MIDWPGANVLFQPASANLFPDESDDHWQFHAELKSGPSSMVSDHPSIVSGPSFVNRISPLKPVDQLLVDVIEIESTAAMAGTPNEKIMPQVIPWRSIECIIQEFLMNAEGSGTYASRGGGPIRGVE